jgi:hypothetical protein
MLSMRMPERHEDFAWAGLPDRSLGRSLVAQAKKITVCVLSAVKVFTQLGFLS